MIIALGSSLGGLRALQTILSGLPERLGASIVMVQHRRADPDSHLVSLLARACRMPVIEPEDKTPLEVDHLYLAPGDYHMLVEHGWLALSVDAPVSFARPSIDVLFESVADAYGSAAVGVMLTSSNHDGAHGLAAIKAAGGRVFVQDPKTAESPIGPTAALASTPVDGVLPLESIAQHLIELCVRG